VRSDLLLAISFLARRVQKFTQRVQTYACVEISVSIGLGPIFGKSSKQFLNSKALKEAEMLVVSDGRSHVLWIIRVI